MYKIRIITLISLLLISVVGFSQSSDSATDTSKQAVIKFENTTHNYGNIITGSDGIAEFRYKNTGNSPLIITNVVATCGCTVPQWDRAPVMPGGTGTLVIKYDTQRLGTINKSATVNSNAKNSAVVLLLKGNVVKPSNTQLPTNNPTAAPFAE
ncbi:MAG: DUF1573 domain-containing protein [Lentimicrobiaceae bacterium]|nr:DUF1573 domain-containing protein [Lentimicrobiaceae bacterium]